MNNINKAHINLALRVLNYLKFSLIYPGLVSEQIAEAQKLSREWLDKIEKK